MKAETEIWQLMTHEGVYQADLPTLKQWVAEGLVRPTDRVRKGGLNWIEAGRAPSLRRVFAGEETPEPAAPPQHEPSAAPDTQHGQAAPTHAREASTHTQAAPAPQAAPTHARVAPTHAHGARAHVREQDLGLASGAVPPGAGARAGANAHEVVADTADVPAGDDFIDAPGGFIEVVSTRDFDVALPGGVAPVAAGAPSLGSSCANHAGEAASLVCRECRQTFCRACPNRMGTSSVMLCPSCGNFCDPLESIAERVSLYERASSGFGSADFLEALAYPLKHLGSLVGGALLYGFLLVVGVRGQLLAYALVYGCITLVVHRVGYGRTEKDFLPDFSAFSFWDDVLVPFFLGLGVTLVTFGPVLLLVAVLFFGWASAPRPSAFEVALKEAERQQAVQQQAMSEEDLKVLTEGGTAEQEAALRRKMREMTPAARAARVVEESRATDETTLGLARGLAARPGLFSLLAVLALAWAVFYHPMALLVAGWTESFKSTVNPLVGLDTMRHMGGNYFKAFGMYLVVQAAALALELAVALVTAPFDMPFVGNVPGRFLCGVVTFYTSLVIACVLGLALFKSADRLGIELD